MSDESQRGTCMRRPLVQYLDETEVIPCPYGDVQRVISNGDGGIANVHVVRITRGGRHYHRAYDEVYYVVSGRGRIWLGDAEREIRPGAAVVIPAGMPHALEADDGEVLEFVIFGTPAMSIDDERARPTKIGDGVD